MDTCREQGNKDRMISLTDGAKDEGVRVAIRHKRNVPSSHVTYPQSMPGWQKTTFCRTLQDP